MTKKMNDSPRVRAVVAMFGRHGFWINEDGHSDWYDTVDEYPSADAVATYITWNAENELVIEIGDDEECHVG